ncbi:MAG: hypothetical protein N2444_06390, partial [Methylocystis sp.]|nr:hypothetical protein [Methylocystis sp.]
MESPYSFPSVLRAAARARVTGRRDLEAFQPATESALPSPPTIPGCIALRPGDPDYGKYLPVYNLRTAVRPALRLL